MGVPGTVQWAAWLGEYVIVMLGVLITMTILLSLPVTIEKVRFDNSNHTTGYVFECRGLLNFTSFALQMSFLLSSHAQWRCESRHLYSILHCSILMSHLCIVIY